MTKMPALLAIRIGNYNGELLPDVRREIYSFDRPWFIGYVAPGRNIIACAGTAIHAGQNSCVNCISPVKVMAAWNGVTLLIENIYFRIGRFGYKMPVVWIFNDDRIRINKICILCGHTERIN